MTIKAPSEKEAKKVKIAVSRDPVTTSFEKWACDEIKDIKIKFLLRLNNSSYEILKNQKH